MKNKIQIMFFLFLPFSLNAQIYSFITTKINYSHEQNLDTLWGNKNWKYNPNFDSTADINLFKNLNFYNKKVQMLSISKNGSIILSTNKFNPYHTVWGASSKYRAVDSINHESIIGVKYKTNMSDTSQLIVEYRNVRFVGRTDSEFVNFKIIFHFDSDSIDLCYGKSFTSSFDWLPFNGLLAGLDTGFSKQLTQFLSGNPDSPFLVNKNINSRLNFFPDEGTKYTFFLINKSGIVPENIIYNFSIYPNPSTSSFTIQYNGVVGRETNHGQELTIYNVLGEVVYKDKWPQGQTQKSIDMGALPKGIYIIKLGDAVQKLIKE